MWRSLWFRRDRARRAHLPVKRGANRPLTEGSPDGALRLLRCKISIFGDA
jgi:hypothetical protein